MTTLTHTAVLDLAKSAGQHRTDYLAAAEEALTARRPRVRARAVRKASACAIESSDDVDALVVALAEKDREVTVAHQHHVKAVHDMVAEERRADRAEEALLAVVAAYASNDESLLDVALVGAISILRGRVARVAVIEARIEAAQQAAAARATARQLRLVVTS